MRFYERFARVAFAESPTQEQDFNLGLYLIFIACFYPGIQFDYPQSLIAASAIHCVLRIKDRGIRWSDYLHREVTSYSEDQLKGCSLRIVRKYVGLCSRNEAKYRERLWVVESLFEREVHCKAALVKPKTH